MKLDSISIPGFCSIRFASALPQFKKLAQVDVEVSITFYGAIYAKVIQVVER